jgi:hypothetical protein
MGTMKYFLSVSAFIFIFITPLIAQQAILNPVKDNTLYETLNGSTSNGVGDFLFIGRVGSNGGGAIRRALIKFDIASSVPAGATITSANLTMHMSKTNSGSFSAKLHRVTSDWGEGTSNANTNEGSGASSSTNDATWIHRFFNTSLWNTPGGDFSSTISASLSVNSVGSYSWGSNSQMVSDVQNWLNNPITNFGWIVIGDESSEGTAKRFDSRQNSTNANRPALTITYTTTTNVSGNSSVPGKTILAQNYPNPFNPTTVIRYQLSSLSIVKLSVFDLLGREVEKIFSGTQSAGNYELIFDGSKLTSGIYFYRLEANTKENTNSWSFVSTKRMLLVK